MLFIKKEMKFSSRGDKKADFIANLTVIKTWKVGIVGPCLVVVKSVAPVDPFMITRTIRR